MDRYPQWRDALQIAPNTKAVKGVMRDYVDSLRPIVGALPPACQRALLADELDVQTAAVTLLHEELRCQGSDETRTLLHEIAYTFASAAVRITLLHGKPVLPVTSATSRG